MQFKEFQKNYELFSQLLEQLVPAGCDEGTTAFIQHYVEQNVTILNEVLAISIEQFKKIQKVKTANEVICIQAKLNNDISKKLSQATQRFLNASLGNVADYNEWLKTHCDLVTDDES